MLPTSLEAATARMMAKDSIAREAAVFGDDFVEHFGGTREHEVRLWNEAVTNWEGEHAFHVPPWYLLVRAWFADRAPSCYPQSRGIWSLREGCAVGNLDSQCVCTGSAAWWS